MKCFRIFHLIWKNYKILTRKVELWIFFTCFTHENISYKHFSMENKLTNIGFHILSIWDGTNFEDFHLSGNFIKLIALIYEECILILHLVLY